MLAKTCPSKVTMPTLKSSAVDSIPSMYVWVLFGGFGNVLSPFFMLVFVLNT